jgi:hypothetical protein
MVDPELQPIFTQLFNDREHLFLLGSCVTDKYLGSHRGVKIRAGFKSLFGKSMGAPGFGKIENQLKVGQGHKKSQARDGLGLIENPAGWFNCLGAR